LLPRYYLIQGRPAFTPLSIIELFHSKWRG
jgi:hypothetical protein